MIRLCRVPGPSSSQLQDLIDATDAVSSQNTFATLSQPSISAGPACASGPSTLKGRKRTSKKRRSQESLDPSRPPLIHPPTDSSSTLGAIMSSLHLITSHPQALEDAAHQPVLPPLATSFTGLNPATTSAPSGPIFSPQFSLASAAVASPAGRAFIPQNVNISASLCSQILQGKDAIRCDKTVSTHDSFSDLLKSTDPAFRGIFLLPSF